MTEPDDARMIGDGRFLKLFDRDGWEFAHRPNCTGIVVIVAVTDEGKLLLTEQYRPPVQSRVIELPAGLAGDIPGERDEGLAAAASRELLEETGYEADEITALAEGPPSPGMSTEIISLMRATGLKKVALGGGDESEDIAVHEVPLAEINGWLAARAAEGILIDPKVYAGLYFAQAADR